MAKQIQLRKWQQLPAKYIIQMIGFDWTGFYRVVAPELLKIGPYQGGHGCLVIPFSKGVCGAAARENRVQLVDDVHAFPGHIACSSSTLSEIVLPVRDGAGNRHCRF